MRSYNGPKGGDVGDSEEGYLWLVALAVFAEGWRWVVVENGAGQVVDYQHLTLQCVLDQEGHAIQPLTLLEHTYTRTYAPGHVRTQDAGRQKSRTQAQT